MTELTPQDLRNLADMGASIMLTSSELVVWPEALYGRAPGSPDPSADKIDTEYSIKGI